MLFNTISFLLFFPTVCLIYWLLPSTRNFRNIFLLIASYYFYMNWEPAYSSLIAISTVTSWGISLAIRSYGVRKDTDKTNVPKILLAIGIAVNVGLLCAFKYLDFLGHEITRVMDLLGISIQIPTFEFLLPVGLSFYTFQVIGYMIDVYRREIEPERNLMTYALFVSFFPQLVAGPIEKAGNLLPQFHVRHRFSANTFIVGITMMLWGYFLKLCVADNVSLYCDAVFGNPANHSGSSCIMAAVLYTFQIFGDFGGYSMIAIGAAQCMGFSLRQNFRQPYLSASVNEFWKRWHMSLTGWLTNYIYIPMGGNRCGHLRFGRNIMTVFLISGLWHGAQWTFIAWGALHGFCMTVSGLKKRILPHRDSGGTAVVKALSILLTFQFVVLSWVLFRARTLHDAGIIYGKIFGNWGALYPGEGFKILALCFLMIFVCMVKEVMDYRNGNNGFYIQPGSDVSVVKKAVESSFLLSLILLCGNFNAEGFIYFQF